MIDRAGLPYVQARWFTPAEGRAIDLIVIHTMEAPEGVHTAADVANYFATTNVQASAHYCIDGGGTDRAIVHCVQEKDVAWGAPGANHNGIHLEHAGYAAFGSGDWANGYSDRMLRLSAQLAALIRAAYDVPIAWLSPDDLVAGRRGFTSHNNVTLAFKRGTHHDPGPNFPVEHYLGYVRAA